jgi:hypothetical protein
MKLKRAIEIKAIWNMVEKKEPDISTERLLETVADICKIDASDVCEALMMTEKRVDAP